MSQNMSTFFTGVRRHPPARVTRSRPAKTATAGGGGGGGATGGGAATAGGCSGLASRNRRLKGGGVGAAGGSPHDHRTTRPVKRLTGGGGPTGVYQSTATSTLRRQQLATPPPPVRPASRRPREIEWIMKPSKRFVQCSESSSEDMVSDMQHLHMDGNRISAGSDNPQSLQPQEQELETPQPMPASIHWMGEKEQVGLERTKVRASRVFCVPSQRIMHVEELKQAQLRQMQPRKIRSPNRSPTRQSPTQSLQPSPSKASSRQASPSRRASARSLDGHLVHVTKTVAMLSTLAPPPTDLISRIDSPNASRPPSPSHSQCPVQMESPSPSPSPCDTACDSASPSTSPCPCPSKKPSPPPSSTSNSSLSTSGTECSVERVDERYRGHHGPRAIRLTSTVIKIMPDLRSASQVSRRRRGSRLMVRAKSHSVFRMGGAVQKKVSKNPAIGGGLQKRVSKDPAIGGALQTKYSRNPSSIGALLNRVRSRDPAIKLAMNAPMIQSIAPPKSVPKVMVSKPVASQSVHHVVSQLTAQLRKAAKIKSPDEYKLPKKASAAKTSLARKTSIYLLMDKAKPNQSKAKATSESPSKNDWVIQPIDHAKEPPSSVTRRPSADRRVPSGGDRVNPYMSDRHPAGHNYDMYLKAGLRNRGQAGKDQAMQRDPSSPRGQPPGQARPTASRVSLIPVNQPRDSYINRTRSRRTSLTRMSKPVSLNRIPQPRPPPVMPPPSQRQEAQQLDVISGAAGKIVRKAQHKVPSTMEDGIDMSYQYFVSIPLTRGRKPQVIRYLYRPMMRQLNPQQSPPGRRSSKRAKRRRAAAGAAGVDALAQQEPEKLDPALVALGGAPLPLEDPPLVEKEEPAEESKRKPTVFDPEVALNSPYKVPPLKLKSRYRTMLEELEHMPYPEERSSRRRRSRRRTRAAGGSDKSPPPEYNTVQALGIGGGDNMATKDVTEGAPAPPIRRPSVINYQPKATRLCTATGAPILYHQPMAITHSLATDCEPMIRTITYEQVEEEEREQLEREQLEREQLEKEQLEREQLEQQQRAKSVSFHPNPVFASKGTTSEQSITSSCTTSSSSSPRRKSKKRKGRTHSKGKGKGHGKGKGRK